MSGAGRAADDGAEFLLQQQLAEDVDLISAYAEALVAVRHLKTKLEPDRRHVARFVADLDLCRKHKVIKIVCPVAVKTERYRRMLLARVEGQVVLDCAFDLDLDIGGEARADTNVTRTRQIARKARQRELCVLKKIYPQREIE